MDFDKALDELRDQQRKTLALKYTRIKGTVANYVGVLCQKFHDHKVSINDHIMMIDSYDGAQHQNLKGSCTSVVSLNSTLCCENFLQNGIKPSESLNILTYHQYIGDETPSRLFPVVMEMYKQKKAIRDNENKVEGRDSKVSFFDLHDGKMLYILTQHSLYSRKYHPFLLCKCQRGQAVKDPSHQCNLIDHEDQIKYFELSKKRMEKKRSRLASNQEYTHKDHMDWVDKHNYGISHFGIHPDLLPRDNILFDIMHCKMAITRRLMTYTRSFLNRSYLNDQKQLEFSDVLNEFMSDHNCLLWVMGGSFARLNGNELSSFVDNVEKVTRFINNSIIESTTMNNICEALLLWKSISRILSLTSYKDVEDFKALFKELNNNLKRFYVVGGDSFLTKDTSNKGNDETFYCHALRFYLPKRMKKLFDEYKVGLGICTMQGFERRNKESKNTMKRFSNGKGNMLKNNMKRLWTVFKFNQNGY